MRSASSGRLSLADLENICALRAAAFFTTVLELHAGIGTFLHKVVVRRIDGALTPDGSSILSDPARSDVKFRKAWLPCFLSVRRHACLSDFEGEVEGWVPFLEEVDLPAPSGNMLLEVVRRKGSTAGVVWMVGVGGSFSFLV